MGITAVAVGLDSHPLQQILRPQPQLPARPAGAMVGQGVAEVFPDGEQGVQPGHRVLEHQAHRFAAQMAQGRAPQLARVLTRELQCTAAGAALREQLQHGPRHGAFATAGWAYQGEAFPRVEDQIQPVEGGGVAAGVLHHQLLQGKHRAGRGGRGHGG